MEWYQGGIAEGVALSRTNGSIFVVFIEGNDEKSKQINEMLNTSAISSILKQSDFVAIRIEANSLTHQQFAQIYKESTAPSIFFIGKNGVVLDIISEAMDENQMIAKINEIVIKNGGKPIETTAINSEPVLEIATPPIENTNTESTEISVEEKMKHAQELIAKKRQEKEDEEKEKERNREIERRKLGQDVQKMKRWQQEQELKEMMVERQKAKREDQEARDRVKRQIEEDKREKAARMNMNLQQSPNSQQEAPKMPARPVNSNNARLQFRMPNGMSITHEFCSSARLQEVIDFLRHEQSQQNFTLSTTFPKREFGDDDTKQTLLELQLVPNSVILVLPARRNVVSKAGSKTGAIMNLVWMLFGPFFGVFNYIRCFIFGAPRAGSSSREVVEDNGEESVKEDETNSSAMKRSGNESKIRRRGNIHQLHEQDSDDENNTWNGNSTQQM